jgi:hypothetical protein
VQPTVAFMRRLIRAASIIARDGRIPKPLKWLAAFGLLPIPGPVDEVALLLLGLVLWSLLPGATPRRLGEDRVARTRAASLPRERSRMWVYRGATLWVPSYFSRLRR